MLLDISSDLESAQKELGCEVEQLLTPLTRFKRKDEKAMFAIDNGAYAGFNKQGFLSLLEREEHAKSQCRFVTVPDVVGDARRTLEVFEFWRYKLTGWKLAFAAQDGQEDLPIPWGGIDAVFIGGHTEWKLSRHAAAICKAAKAMDKWVHAGRVNTPARYEYFERLGADSIDGTGLSRYSWMREAIYNKSVKPGLFHEKHDEVQEVAASMVRETKGKGAMLASPDEESG